MMERFRIEWRQGPSLIAREAWVIDLDLTVSSKGGSFLLAKRLQVVIPVDELSRVGVNDPGWAFWRAAVAVASGLVIRRVNDERYFDHPSQPFQLVPDLAEAAQRAAQMEDAAVEDEELVLEFAG
jgi:hypothetical protein